LFGKGVIFALKLSLVVNVERFLEELKVAGISKKKIK
jgi:hypothetical protein